MGYLNKKMVNKKLKELDDKLMDLICKRCGSRWGDHYGVPEDSCWGEKKEKFIPDDRKKFKELKEQREEILNKHKGGLNSSQP